MQSPDATNPSQQTPRRRLQLAAALLACATAVAVLATSATARPPIVQAGAPSLQKDVDSLVQAGVPGAILVAVSYTHLTLPTILRV